MVVEAVSIFCKQTSIIPYGIDSKNSFVFILYFNIGGTLTCTAGVRLLKKSNFRPGGCSSKKVPKMSAGEKWRRYNTMDVTWTLCNDSPSVLSVHLPSSQGFFDDDERIYMVKFDNNHGEY